MSAGSCQLLVGPASFSFSEQMKVRSSTRATSAGSDQIRKLFGRLLGSSFRAVPLASIRRVISSYSAWEPSHQ